MQIRKGITLVEVLVVMSILVALLAIGYVMMAPARQKGYEAQCTQQMRQIYMAFALYDSDHNPEQVFPGPSIISTIAQTTFNRLMPYVDNEQEIFYCPQCKPHWREVLFSTYTPGVKWYRDDQPQFLPKNQKRIEQIEREGNAFVVLRCDVHDQIYYQKRDRGASMLVRNPFVLDIRADGSAFMGRKDVLIGDTDAFVATVSRGKK
jgi:prepilin-type N-terminal cleavage/methylation domain-containing protein